MTTTNQIANISLAALVHADVHVDLHVHVFLIFQEMQLLKILRVLFGYHFRAKFIMAKTL